MTTIEQQAECSIQDRLLDAARSKLADNAELIADDIIPMRDGIPLSANLHRPRGTTGALPVAAFLVACPLAAPPAEIAWPIVGLDRAS